MQQWAGTTAGAAVFPNGELITHGATEHRFELASITKLYTALAALVAHEEGTLDLDTQLGDGFTTADLLAHTAGIAPDDRRSLADPRTRRIYSTAAYEMVRDAKTARISDDWRFRSGQTTRRNARSAPFSAVGQYLGG